MYKRKFNTYWLIDNPICELEKTQNKTRDGRGLVADEKMIEILKISFQQTNNINSTEYVPNNLTISIGW